MNWLILALASAVTFTLADFFGKLSSDKLHPYLGAFIINLSSALILLIPLTYFYLRGDNVLTTKPLGIPYAIIAGITVGLASLFLFKTFASGVNLSVSVPVVRTGIVVLATILGVIFLKEGFSLKALLGVGFSVIGIYLVSTAK
jgi:uncharacterized membrane protein